MLSRGSRFVLATTAIVLGGATGCRGCDDSKAYTPFGVASVMPSSSEGGAPPAPSASAGFTGKKDLVAPPNTRSWKIGDLTATLPEGRVFERALAADFDGDGRQDAVAWTIPAPSKKSGALPPSNGQLVYFPAQGPSRVLQSAPTFVPTGPGCRLDVELRQTGPHTLLLDAGANCMGATLVARVPVRGLYVVAPAAARPVLMAFRAADPPAGETLDLDVQSSDIDGDGRDDVRLRVSAGKRGTPPATANFVWFDRAAGPARDALEPKKSFQGAAGILTIQAKGKHTRLKVPDGVANLRRLFADVCSESGTARVFDGNGEPLACGSLGSTFERLSTAEVEAALGANDALEALAALTRADWYGTQFSDAARRKLQQRIEKAIPTLEIKASPTVHAEVAPRTGPRWSPLAFEPDGSLLIESKGSLVRLGADGHDEAVEPPAPPAPPAGPDGGGGAPAALPSAITTWPLDVRSSTRLRWTGTTLSCDRSEIALTFAKPTGALAEPEVTSLLAPRPGACAPRNHAAAFVPTAPLSWHGDKLSAVVAGSIVGGARPNFDTPTSLSARGTALSPDGHRMVALTSAGLAVTGSKGTELWKLDGILDGPDALHQLSDCVVSNDARSTACVQRERVRFFVRP